MKLYFYRLVSPSRVRLGDFETPMRARLFAVALLIAMVSIIQNSTAHAENYRFRIGMILPLTGPTADYGRAIQNSITLAREDSPNEFKNIEFIFEDASSENRSALTLFQRFRTVGATDMAYTWGVAFCKILAPLAEQNHFVTVSQCIDPTASRGRDYFLRFMNSNDEFVEKTVQYLVTKGHHKVGIVVSESPYLEDILSVFERAADERLRVTILDRFPTTEMNFRSTIVKLKSQPFDAVGAFLFPGQIAAFSKQALEQKSSIPIFGTNYFESVSEVQASQGAMENAVFASTRLNQEFVDRYRKRFGNDSQLAFGGPSYEFARTIARVFGNLSEKLNSAEILGRLRSIPPQSGVAAGPYKMLRSDSAGTFVQFPLVMKRVNGEHFQVIE